MRKSCLIALLLLLVAGCGFQPRGAVPLPPALHRMTLQTPNPYGPLAISLKKSLALSGVMLQESPHPVDPVLKILSETQNQQQTSISSTLLTRQYDLTLTVTFEITTGRGRMLVAPQSVSETRSLTVLSDQVLASTNEVAVLYQQMREAIAYDIMNRLGSHEVSRLVMPGRLK